MTQPEQILWGAIVLGICAVLHVAMLAVSFGVLERAAHLVTRRALPVRVAFLTGTAFGMIVLSHTIQVWFWAWTLVKMEAISYLYDAVYFALVTYTTVGYGDITLPVEFRVYGAFAGVSGILCFGVSTAFLVALLSRLMPQTRD